MMLPGELEIAFNLEPPLSNPIITKLKPLSLPQTIT